MQFIKDQSFQLQCSVSIWNIELGWNDLIISSNGLQWVSKPEVSNFLQKETPKELGSNCEFCEIFSNSVFTEYLRWLLLNGTSHRVSFAYIKNELSAPSYLNVTYNFLFCAGEISCFQKESNNEQEKIKRPIYR